MSFQNNSPREQFLLILEDVVILLSRKHYEV